MATTYTLISSNVLSSSAASVTFSSIPSTYTDLVLRISARSSETATITSIEVEFNSTASSYSITRLRGNGSAASSSRSSNQTQLTVGTIPAASATSNTFGSIEVYIPSYTASQNKALGSFNVGENNATAADIYTHAGLWSNTAAISSIVLDLGGFNFVSGSSFYLYGIKNS